MKVNMVHSNIYEFSFLLCSFPLIAAAFILKLLPTHFAASSDVVFVTLLTFLGTSLAFL